VITSKDVFTKRKEGALDEAYQMALQLMGAHDVGEWDRKAMGWCLVDLIKRDAEAGKRQTLEHYRRQLESLKVAPDDAVLQKGIRNALSMCSPNGLVINQASLLSKQGRHVEAIALYRQLWSQGELNQEAQTNLGWALYRHSKQLLASEHVNFGAVKRNLHDYLKLDVEKPSLLHACFLQLAAKLAGEERLNMLKFLQLWDLNHLREEDWQRHRAEDGKEFPSLVEKVIQQAGKAAAESKDTQDLNYILPHIDAAIQRFPDNIWLKLDKAKVLLASGEHDEALTFGIAVVKSKTDDYWAWELLGDIVAATDATAALGCYCKALCCRAEEKFTGKVRLKLARLMIDSSAFAPAKHEVETLVRQKEKDGQRIPDAAVQISLQPWFASTQANVSNLEYYRSHLASAESLLLARMPWIVANLGEWFVVPGKENKRKRRVFVETSADPLEASFPDGKFGHDNLAAGEGVRIKGEFDETKRFKIYAVEPRAAQGRWDVFRERIGVVDHVNKEKNVLHFIVDRAIDGIISLADLPGQFREGNAIAVKLSRFSTKKGHSYRVLNAEATEKTPSTQIWKEFNEEVRVSNGMGFTLSDIFIPPPFVEQYRIRDGQTISGAAVLSFNKKRQEWGWKAISLAS